jgi:hypothetical protein
MDISKLDVVKLSNEGYQCVIKNPKDGSDTDIVVTIKGVFADSFREDAEKADTAEKTCAFLAKFSVDWKGIEEDGKVLEFSVKEAERIYIQYPIIRNQVFNAAWDVRNFIKD